MPDQPKRGVCRVCKARTLTVRVLGCDAPMELDAEPDPEGNIVVKDGVGEAVGRDAFFGQVEGERFMPHQQTCTPAYPRRRR